MILASCGASEERKAAHPEQPRSAQKESDQPAAEQRPHDEILRSIDAFLDDPERAIDAEDSVLAKIIEFVKTSPDVMVVVDVSAAPWTGDDITMELNALLLAGYIAGNARAQLRSGIKADDIYAGTAGVLQVYRSIKQRFHVVVPEVEKLLAMEARGELKAHLDDIKQAREHRQK